jgi:hypothetical protein
VDTRSKIVTAAEAPRSAVLVAGGFDVLCAEQVRELQQIRGFHPARPLVAAVLPCPDAVLSLQARAEMTAALRMVDYVLIVEPAGQSDDLDGLIDRLQPAAIVRLDGSGTRRLRRLIEHVRNG